MNYIPPEKNYYFAKTLGIVLCILFIPLLIWGAMKVFDNSLESVAKGNIEILEAEVNLGMTKESEVKELGFNHDFGVKESSLGRGGVLAKAELFQIEDLDIGHKKGQSISEVVFKDKDGKINKYQGYVSLHFIQDKETKPVFVVDGNAKAHVWLNPGDLEGTTPEEEE